jgi:AcrR family transcriptional regulator
MERVKRRYRSPRREAHARETRRAILEAALELFTSRGFAATSIRQVAERAGVSEQTIYNVFADKIGILHAAGMAYAELAAGQADAEFLEALKAEPDPIRRIRMVARSSRELWDSGGVLELDLMVLNPDQRDPRLVELQRMSLAYRHESTRAVCEVLFPADIRRPGLDLDEIAAFATAVDSGAVVTMLRSLGWSMDRWEAWLVELMALFLDPARVPGARRRGAEEEAE